MTTEHAPDSAFPSSLDHKHGLDDWWPMLPERSAETIEPGLDPTERLYRCQKIGCMEIVRLQAVDLRTPAAAGAGSSASGS